MAVRYETYAGEERDLAPMMALVDQELSEPYNIYTFRHFLEEWPHLCFLAYPEVNDEDISKEVQHPIACIVSKQDMHRGKRTRGYIAMLSVERAWRRKGIARRLVELTIEAMQHNGAQEAVLETECDNDASLKLYHSFGFFREKRLHRFYLNGKDAFRLVLPLPSAEDYEEDALSETTSERSLARATLSSAAEWAIANGDRSISAAEIESRTVSGGQLVADEIPPLQAEMTRVLETIDRTDLA